MGSYPLKSVLKPASFAADEKSMEPTNPLDPSIVERYAEYLQERASARIMGYTIALALFGSILGSVPLLAPNRVLIPHSLGLALLLVGAAAGGYLGYTIGVRRAEGLKLQAEVTLHQVQVELMLVQPSAAVARTIERIGDRAMLSTPPAAAPAVASPAPAPVAPVAVAPAPARVAPAPVAPAPAAAAPAPAPVSPVPVPVAPVPLPAVAAPAVAPPAPVAPIPVAPTPVAMPPLSAPAPAPTHHEPPASPPPVSAAPPAQQPPAVPPLAAALQLPTVPRLVEAPPASPPTMMPPISVER